MSRAVTEVVILLAAISIALFAIPPIRNVALRGISSALSESASRRIEIVSVSPNATTPSWCSPPGSPSLMVAVKNSGDELLPSRGWGVNWTVVVVNASGPRVDAPACVECVYCGSDPRALEPGEIWRLYVPGFQQNPGSRFSVRVFGPLETEAWYSYYPP